MMDNVFGKYRIAVLKTTGSPNPAYHARSGLSFEWNYVVKVYATHPVHTKAEEEVFHQHIMALNQLENPHILPITDYGFEKNIPFYVTRHLAHGSLRERMEQNSPTSLSIQEMITIIVQVGQALQYAHDQHIVHGNIKPENILFNANNDTQLIDFQLPKNFGGKGNVAKDTTRFSYYPEGETLNEKSDQYALGSLANELLGNLLPSTPTLLSLPQQDVTEIPKLAFSRSTNEVLRQIKTKLMKAMARDPKARYKDIATFVEALNKVGTAQFVITSSEPITFATPAPVNNFLHSAKTMQTSVILPQWKQHALIKGNFIHRLLFIVAIVLLLCFLLSGSILLFFSGKLAKQTTASPLSAVQGLNGTSIILTPQAINPIRPPALATASAASPIIASPTPLATASPTVKPSSTPGATPSPIASPPSTAVLGYWKFDQGSGSIASDSSGNGYTGTLQGKARWGSPHAGSSALNLDGSYGTSVDIPTPVVNTAQSFSVSAWVKVSSFSSNVYQTFVSIDGNQVSGFYLQWRRGTNKFAFVRLSGDTTSAPSTIALASSVPATNIWYNLIGVYDASAQTMSLYVNGTLQQTVPYTGSWQAGGHTKIGCGLYNGRAIDFVVGEIDSVYIYRGALTASDAANLAATG